MLHTTHIPGRVVAEHGGPGPGGTEQGAVKPHAAAAGEPITESLRAPVVMSLGQIWVDIMMSVDEIPQTGDFVVSRHITQSIGGSYRMLLAARRMGSPARHAGIIGQGMMAASVRSALAVHGIEHIGQDRLDADTGMRLVLTDGERKTFIATYGAEAQGGEDLFDAIEPDPGDVVHISGNSLLDHSAVGIDAFFERTLANPQNRPYTVVLNPTNALELVSDQLLENMILSQPIWSCNRQEAKTLANRLGIPLEFDRHVTVGGGFDDAMLQLCTALGETMRAPLVLRAGARGAWVREPGGPVTHIDGFPVKPTHIRSAGNCHTGVLCAMLAQGWSLLDAVTIANAACSLAIEHHRNGIPECPQRREVKDFLQREHDGQGEHDGR